MKQFDWLKIAFVVDRERLGIALSWLGWPLLQGFLQP
jgi:hypothetical protein